MRNCRSQLGAGRVYQVHTILNFRDPRPPHLRDLLHDLGFQQIVGVEKDDNFPSALLEAKHMSAQLIGFRPKVGSDPILETFYDGPGVIGRGVIYDNHLLVRPIDCERAFNRSSDEVAIVIVSDDDRQFHSVYAAFTKAAAL